MLRAFPPSKEATPIPIGDSQDTVPPSPSKKCHPPASSFGGPPHNDQQIIESQAIIGLLLEKRGGPLAGIADHLARGYTRDTNYFDCIELIGLKALIARQDEPSLLPSHGLFEKNHDIYPTMRCKLINWLIEVCLHFRLHRETFFLAIHYVDRFLSLRSGVPRHRLQLIGVAALFIAAKLEEIYPPTLKEFSEVCDGSCSPKEISQMELDILMEIGWKLNVATPFFWIGCFLELMRPHLGDEHLEGLRSSCVLLLKTAIHMPGYLMFPYSIIAASLIFVRLPEYDLVSFCTGYEYNMLRPCIEWLWELLHATEQIVFFEPTVAVSSEQFKAALEANGRVMHALTVRLEHQCNPTVTAFTA